nr:unnamed protein product [Spirometra erinaceieuropaei]
MLLNSHRLTPNCSVDHMNWIRRLEKSQETFSFDERLRIWDLRAPKSPLVKEVVHTVGGGVWRHKWANPSASHFLLAAMHAGFAVGAVETNDLDPSNDRQAAPLVSYYRQTSELAYAAEGRTGLIARKQDRYKVAITAPIETRFFDQRELEEMGAE